MPHFGTLKIYSCGKHCEKGEIAPNRQFLLFSQCFLFYLALIFRLKSTLKCCLQFVSIWTSLKFCHLVMGLPFPKQALVFICLQYKSFENTVGKGEIACNEQFLLFTQCFLPVWRTFCHFH